MIKKLSKRFDQLAEEIESIEATKRVERSELGDLTTIDNKLLLSWVVKTKNLLISLCGEKSHHLSEFVKAGELRGYDSSYKSFERMQAVFFAAQDDFKGGYIVSLKSIIQAEVFDSELEQATELLQNGYKVAAAVIAGVVLETSLRDICTQEGIAHSKLDKMNTDLAKAGVYNKLQQKRVTALADIRNSAAHGRSEAFSEGDVKMMITEIEQFLAKHLS